MTSDGRLGAPRRDVIAAIVAVMSLLPLVAMAKLMVASFDITDEGYYLLAMAEPRADSATVQFFGWVLHPLWTLAGADLVAVRLAGGLIGWAAFALMAWSVLRLAEALGFPPLSRTLRAALAIGIGSGSMALLPMFPLSPGYALVAACGLALTVGATSAAWRRPDRWWWWCLAGTATALTFLGKPTTGVLWALLTAGCIGIAGAPRVRTLGLYVAGGLGGMATFLVAARLSPREFWRRFWSGYEYEMVLGGRDAGFLRWDPLPSSPTQYLPAAAGALALLAVGALAIDLVRHRHSTPARPWGRWVLVAGLVLAPLAAALGTNNNLWAAMGRFPAFWTLAAVLAVGALSRRWWSAALLTGLSLVLLTVQLGVGADLPYRQPPLQELSSSVEVRGSRVGATPSQAAAIQEMLERSHGAGLTPGTPILDLTGSSPGVIYALGGRPVGRAWLLGGYRGSDAAAENVLALAPCETAAAWVLWEPGSRALDPDVLLAVGRDLTRDFEKVASWSSLTAGTDALSTGLYRPLDPRPEAC